MRMLLPKMINYFLKNYQNVRKGMNSSLLKEVKLINITNFFSGVIFKTIL